jgi:hypothetical protein
MPTLFRWTKRENQWPGNVLDYFGKVPWNRFEAIETQLDQISPLDRLLTRVPKCIEILLAHGDTNAG